MILMTIVAIVGQHKVRRNLALQLLEEVLDVRAVVRKESIPKFSDRDPFSSGASEKQLCAATRLSLPPGICREHQPVDVNRSKALDQMQDRAAAADLDVICMRPDAKNAERGTLIPIVTVEAKRVHNELSDAVGLQAGTTQTGSSDAA